VDTTGWLDRVPALLQAWFPGQEGGTAVAEILLGDVNPSGRLPATFERRWEDNPVYDYYYPEPGTLKTVYTEGVFFGYRGFEREGVAPLFPFGHGLSYTTFEYGELSVSPETTGDGNVEVSFDLTNTGDRAGAEVAQVYVADSHSQVPRPPKELKGFTKVFLEPGEKQRVTISLDRRSFAYYDVESGDWAVAPGDFEILVGRSSEAIELRRKLRFTK
jgi:beta-glucosidase